MTHAMLIPLQGDPSIVAGYDWTFGEIGRQLVACDLDWQAVELGLPSGRKVWIYSERNSVRPINPSSLALLGFHLHGPLLVIAIGEDGEAADLTLADILHLGGLLLFHEMVGRELPA